MTIIRLKLCVLGLCLAGCPAIAVSAQAALAQGITEPYRDSRVSPSVGGAIVAVLVAEGQLVKAGDPVIALDSELETIEVERRRLVAEDRSELDAALGRLETLRIDLEGTRILSSQTRSVSVEELRRKELEFLLAEADVNRLRSAEKREELEYRIAVEQLAKRTIRAPFDGIVVEFFLDIGENCNPQLAVFRLVDVGRCRLVLHVEQAASLRLSLGRAVTLRIREAEGSLTVAGTVDFVSPIVDASSGLREVKVLFENPERRIHPGVTGSVLER